MGPGRFLTPIRTWFADDRAPARFRARQLGRTSVVLPPLDHHWRRLVPGFPDAIALAGSGVPFQIVADRRYDRSADRRRIRRALADGQTIFLPQVHEILPRLARLMAALRAGLFGPRREECSFLFMVEGRGRPAMGLHHDGEVDAVWLQLEGRRTVAIGPPVRAGTPKDLPSRVAARGRGWSRLELRPGSLLYLPPRTPHDVVCHGRSLALSLTWSRARGGAAALSGWKVVSGRADRIPASSRRRLWTQVPAVAGPLDHGRRAFPLHSVNGTIWLPAGARPFAARLVSMPSFSPASVRQPEVLARLSLAGVVAPRDLPLRITPAAPDALDGWRFV